MKIEINIIDFVHGLELEDRVELIDNLLGYESFITVKKFYDAIKDNIDVKDFLDNYDKEEKIELVKYLMKSINEDKENDR